MFEHGLHLTPFLAMAAGALTSVAFASLRALWKTKQMIESHRRVVDRLSESMRSCELFLSHPESPKELRLPLLAVLKGMTNQDMAIYLSKLMDNHSSSGIDNEVGVAVAKLRLSNPQLADYFDEAAFGLVTIGIPLRSVSKAEKIENSQVATPAKAIGRVGKLAQEFDQRFLPFPPLVSRTG